MKNKADIIFILDRSGSMNSIKSSTIEGFNKFISDQQKIKGEAVISLYQFDDKFEVIYENQDINKSPYLTDKTFVPRGMTSLYDAIGKTIINTGERLRKTPESDRPDKVIFVILTDGQENNSTDYNAQKIRDMIKHQSEKYNWQFIFLGANQDAVLSAQKIGINLDNSMTFNANTKGVSASYASISSNIASYRQTGNAVNLTFNKQDREAQGE